MAAQSVANQQEKILIGRIGIQVTDDPGLPLTEQQWSLQYTATQLKSILRQLNLPATGLKDDLVKRLVEQPRCPPNILDLLMSNWFLSPLSGEQLKIGSVNEGNILKALPRWLNEQDTPCTIENGLLVQRGLLRRHCNGMPSNLATSIDSACSMAIPIANPAETVPVSPRVAVSSQPNVVLRSIPVVVKLKTVTEEATTIAKTRVRLSAACSQTGVPTQRFFRVTCRSQLFHTLVWTPQYRTQVLHHCAVTSVNHCLFSVANKGTIAG